MNILIILFVITFSFLAWRKPEWAVLAVVAALPSYMIRFNVLGVPMTLLEAMILVVFVVWVITDYHRLKTNFTKMKHIFKKSADTEKVPYPFQWEMILLLIISFVSVGVAGFSSQALGIWKAYFFEPMLFYIVVMNVFIKKAPLCHSRENGNPEVSAPIVDPRLLGNDKEKTFNLERLFWALAISAIAVSILAIYQKITGQFIYNELWAAEGTRRVVSFFGYPNAVGLYLGPLVLLFVGWLFDSIKNQCLFCHSCAGGNPEVDAPIMDSRLRGDDKNKAFRFIKLFFIIVAISLSLLSIFFAKSEGALIGIAAGLVIFGLLAGGKLRWATIIGVVIISAGIFSYTPARNFAVNKLTLNDFSGQVRKLQWTETWKMLKDGRIVFGSGLNNYQNDIKPYHQDGFFYNKDNDPDFRRKIVIFDEKYKVKYWQPLEIYMYPHNILLNFWTELGLFGMLLFVWIIIKFFKIGYWNLFGNWKPVCRRGRLEIGNLDKKKNKFIVIGLICSMIVILIHGLVDVPYFKNDLAVMFWIFLAIASIFKIKEKV